MKTSVNTNSQVIQKSNVLQCGRVAMNESNGKLKNIGFVRWLIWNLSAIVTCPYATEACKANCYAKRDETQYRPCREQRIRNTSAVQDPCYDWVSDVIAIINKKIEKTQKSLKGSYCLIIRIHESGDFYNQAYFDAWMYIASQFSSNKQVYFSAYTKSLPYIADYCKRHNLKASELPVHFISSIWEDTKDSMIELTKSLDLSTYGAGCKMSDVDYECNCDVDECAECRKCYIGKHHITVKVNDSKERAKRSAAKRLANKANKHNASK